MALCLPRSRTAAFSATRPTTWLSASIMYHLRSTCSALALKVFIGSRKLSHDARDVSKIFVGIIRGLFYWLPFLSTGHGDDIRNQHPAQALTGRALQGVAPG